MLPSGVLVVFLATVICPFGFSVSSVVLPGVTSGSGISGSMLSPVAVALFTTDPFRISCSVTTYLPVNASLVSFGASSVTVHSLSSNGSDTVMFSYVLPASSLIALPFASFAEPYVTVAPSAMVSFVMIEVPSATHVPPFSTFTITSLEPL